MCDKSIATLINENIKAEADALEQYQGLIEKLYAEGHDKAADAIKEIMSDEKQHLLKLIAICFDFDGDIKISNDETKAIIQAISSKII